MNIPKGNLAKKLIRAGLFATLCSVGVQSVTMADTVTSTTKITSVGGNLFNIQANADGMTADQRAAIIQKKLDDALFATKNISPALVSVDVVNRNPVVMFNEKLIATADGNSAARLDITQLELANRWADTLKNYLQTLTVSSKKRAGDVFSRSGGFADREEVAVLPIDATLPVELTDAIVAADAHCGQPIDAMLTTDVPLGPSFRTYLPAGSHVRGELVYASNYAPNHYGGKGALTPHFYGIRTPDGKDIPIDAYLLGDITEWKSISVKPIQAVCCDKANVVDVQAQSEELRPKKGEIVGSWRGFSDHYNELGYTGLPSYRSSNLNYNGLIIPKRSFAVIPEHAPMLLRTATTSSIAVASGPNLTM
jgi:hypothetical protein